MSQVVLVMMVLSAVTLWGDDEDDDKDVCDEDDNGDEGHDDAQGDCLVGGPWLAAW